GIKLWQKAGYKFGIITGRTSQIVKVRATELGIDIVRQGVANKLTAVEEIARQHELELNQICFIGDDFPDLPAIRAVGLGATVPEAPEEIREGVKFITSLAGGYGAVRNLIETILKNQRRWEAVIQQYYV
ncbi:MAG: KdsC family phosphatase, partial [Thermoguttaceae bacterium]